MLACRDVSPHTSPHGVPWASLAGGLGAVLLPKCPACFAAYGSALAALGLAPVAHRWLVEPLITLGVIGSFGLVLGLAVPRRDAVTPLVSALGAALVLAGRFAFGRPAITAVGTVLLVAAALTNSAGCRVPRAGPAG